MAYYLRIARKDNNAVAGTTTEAERAHMFRAGDVIELLPGDHVFGAQEFVNAGPAQSGAPHIPPPTGLVRINDPSPSAAILEVAENEDRDPAKGDIHKRHRWGEKFIQMTVWLPSLAPPQRAAFNGAENQSEILTLANSTSLEAAIGTRPAIT